MKKISSYNNLITQAITNKIVFQFFFIENYKGHAPGNEKKISWYNSLIAQPITNKIVF